MIQLLITYRLFKYNKPVGLTCYWRFSKHDICIKVSARYCILPYCGIHMVAKNGFQFCFEGLNFASLISLKHCLD